MIHRFLTSIIVLLVIASLTLGVQVYRLNSRVNKIEVQVEDLQSKLGVVTSTTNQIVNFLTQAQQANPK